MHNIWLFWLLVTPSFAATLDSTFEKQVEEVMQEVHVPGLAIVVLQAGKVVYEKGFGYRDVKRKLPMTPDTLTNVCSINKSLTAAALGILVDEGKLGWDISLKTYLPDLELSDPQRTENTSAKDVLSHRTGIPRHDLAWEATGFSNEEMYRRLRHLPASKPFRSEWQYSNLLYMVLLDRLIEKVSGVPYADFVTQRLLRPLGLKRSTLSEKARNADANSARPYYWADGKYQEIKDGVYDRYSAAGAWNTSARELAQWGLFQLGEGEVSGKAILSPSSLKELQTPQMNRPNPGLKLGEGVTVNYGLGWQLYDLTIPTPQRLAFHTGGAAGFSSHLDFMPSTKTVVAIVTNQDIGGYRPETFIALEIHRRLSGLPVKPLKELIQDHPDTDPSPEIPPAEPLTARLEAFVGTYVHPGYGEVTLTKTKRGLQLTWYKVRSGLSRKSNARFEVENKTFLRKFGESRKFEDIELDVTGDRATALRWMVEPKLEPLVFTRK